MLAAIVAAQAAIITNHPLGENMGTLTESGKFTGYKQQTIFTDYCNRQNYRYGW